MRRCLLKQMRTDSEYGVTKPCCKENALVYARSKKEEYDEVEISSQLLEISDIKDSAGNNIFQENSKKIYGWLIFIDEVPFANWGHLCKYIFYVGKSDGMEEVYFEENALFPPNDTFSMEGVE